MPPRNELHLATHAPAETLALGERLGHVVRPGNVVALIGDLGAGKTLLTKGIFRGLNGDPREVISPTFVLMTRHEGRSPLYHFDAYRLQGAGEILDIGAEESFYGDGVSVVEWADRVIDALPDDRLEVHMNVRSPNEREIRLRARGEQSAMLLERLRREK